jgi:SAM-dependent methyltransferase
MTRSADPYETIALEYYDANRHPTSANFRHLSKRILREVLPGLISESSDLLEVGCGDSVVMEVIAELGLEFGSALLTDSSPTMLGYSERWRGPRVDLALADAEHLAFEDERFDLSIAVLGDPYNTEAFWSEMHRTTRRDGHVIYTTPSRAWSVAFRGESRTAAFDPETGPDRYVPSYVYGERAQRAMIKASGLRVIEVIHAPLSWLGDQRISPKLSVLRTPEQAVVTAYVARRS